MSDSIISAEVEPLPGQANQAAIVLQRRGFRILHIGTTISIQATAEQMTEFFHVTFVLRKKMSMPEVGGRIIEFHQAVRDHMEIPMDLQSLISDVIFVEPPGVPMD